MPSVFDIAGEIDLTTGAFEGSLRAVETRLKATDKALDSTIAKSNKLGDTSATTARRLEKISEAIQAQRNRLLDNALAYEKGEISSKKFSSVLIAVDKATVGLNSRLKDAKVRLTELNETGLTGFQQSVSKAIQDANSKLEAFRKTIAVPPPPAPPPGSLFSSLSGQQKTQLSFQLNDVLTGLASGQNPFQILAQQGGQIVQIFQQGKAAQEGVAAATTTAATAQAAFAASAKTSAVSQAQVAVSSAATATSMEAAAASSTILGASVVSLGAVLAAGLVSILAVYKLTQQIQKAAEDRLKVEEAIVGALNRQYLAKIAFQDRLKAEASQRTFDTFSDSASIPDLQAAIDRITRERDASSKAIIDEINRRATLLDALPVLGSKKDEKGRPTFITDVEETEAQKKVREQQNDEISKLTARIAELRKSRAEEFSKWTQETGTRTAKAYQDQVEATLKFEEQKKKMLEESIRKAKEYAEHVKKAGEAVVGIFASTSNNPFVKIFTDAEDAVQKMREATKGLGKDLQATLEKLLRSQAETKSFAQSLDNALKASSLRNEAKGFMGGVVTDAAVRQQALNRIFPNYSSNEARERDLQEAIKAITNENFQANIDRQLKAIGANSFSQYFLDDKKLAELDKRIIAITQGSEGKLDYSQNRLATDARLREAARLESQPEDAQKTQKELLEVLKKLQAGKALSVEFIDPNNATRLAGVSGDVDARYRP